MWSAHDTNVFVWLPVFSIKSSLKDDDSGDHDQDQGSPKDSEKEKTEDEDKEQNSSKKKVGLLKNDSFVLAASKLIVGLNHCLVLCRWWCRGLESTLSNTTTPSGTRDAPQGDQPALRATNRTLNRLAASPQYVAPRALSGESTQLDITLARHN